MQGEPTSVQGPCRREVIIEGQEQLPLQQSVARGKSATLDHARISMVRALWLCYMSE
jgi:hypothetical protein